jgi:NTP pyrophosphatase (non-canonical NTP hydrolase)
MEIKEFQKEILRAFSEIDKFPNRKKHTKQSAVIHLIEEVGEMAKQVTNEYHRPEKFDKKNFGEELTDVLMFIVVLADLYDLNLSEEMQNSIKRVDDKIKRIKEKNK